MLVDARGYHVGASRLGAERAVEDGEQFNVPVYLVERSKVLQGLCDLGGAPAVPLRSHELRAHLQFTAKTGLTNQIDAPANSSDRSHVLKGLIQVLHAADYLEDDETVMLAARILAEELFFVPACRPFVTEVLDCLSENVALAVLKSSELPLPHLLSRLSPCHHALALLATNTSIDCSSSISLPLMPPSSTMNAVKTLAHRFPHVSALHFRPWLPPTTMVPTLRSLENLSNMLSLDMSCMHVSIPAAGAISSALWQMPQLQQLNLSETSLGATGAALLLPAAANLQALRTLLLRGCGLEAAGTEGQCMPLSPRLRMLDLSQNRLGDRGARALAMVLSGCSHGACSVEESDADILPPWSAACQLQWLHVSANKCSAQGLLAVAKALQLLPCIQEVALVARSDVKTLADGTACMLLQALGPQVSCIRQLHLGDVNERLCDRDVEALSPLLHMPPGGGFSCMPTLCDLDMSHMELPVEWCSSLAYALQQARMLRSLKLVCCDLDTHSLEAILLSVSGAVHLSMIDLRGNLMPLLSWAMAAVISTLPTLHSLSKLCLCIAPRFNVQEELQPHVATGSHNAQFLQLLTPRRIAYSSDRVVTCPVALASDALGAALHWGGKGCSTTARIPSHACAVDTDMCDDACSSHNYRKDATESHASIQSCASPLSVLNVEVAGLDGLGTGSAAVERFIAALSPHLALIPKLRELHLEHGLNSSALSHITHYAASHRVSSRFPQLACGQREANLEKAFHLVPALTALTSLNLSIGEDDSRSTCMDRGLQDLAALIRANSMLQELVLAVASRGGHCRVIGEGAGRSAFSNALNRLTGLRHLDLCEEMCDEEFLRAAFMHARFLSSLKDLHLSLDGHCKITRVAEALAQGRALRLRRMNLHGLHISHACVAQLLRYTAQGSALEEVRFDSDWITEDVATQLAPAIGSMPCLQVLCFARNPMRDRGVAQISKQLKNLDSLRTLSFCCCHMSSAGVVALANNLTCLSRLQIFRLSGELVGPVAMSQALAPALAMLGALSELQLHDNHVGDEGAAALGRWLQGHKVLHHVSLTSNDVMDEGALALACCFQRLPALQRVNVTGNRFGEAGHAAMAALQVSVDTAVESPEEQMPSLVLTLLTRGAVTDQQKMLQ